MSDTEIITGDVGKVMLRPRGQYSDTETYEGLDFVYSGGASYVAKKLTTGNTPAEDNEYWQLLARGGTLTENSDVSNTTVTFEKAGSRINIFSKDSLSVIAGKVSKWLTDLKTVAFSGKYSDLEGRLTVTNNDLANVPGTAWDAVRGAAIRQDVDKINSDLSGFKYVYSTDGTTTVKELADSLPKNTFLLHCGWNALSDYPSKDGGIWVLEILKGNINNTPRIMLSKGNSIYSGYYHIGETDAVAWYKVGLTKVDA